MSKLPYKVKALYEYNSPHDDDLSFPNAQIISITEEVDDDWYQGAYTDSAGNHKEGLFPRNFVERYEPETPPRPVRSSRPKKEPEQPLQESHKEVPKAEEPPARAQAPSVDIPTLRSSSNDGPSSPQASKAVSSPPEVAAVQAPVSSKPKPVHGTSKGLPPAVAEKPSGGSFKDRIAAFNKPAAPPVAPFKPGGGGGTGFIKKPFVAPPPSKDAYVPPPKEAPPQKIYRREEDPSLAQGDEEEVERAIPVASPPIMDDEEDEPKPTSLKDRIALLQKQQLEQAARQAEAAQKKEKPKRPSKPRPEVTDPTDEGVETGDLQKVTSADTIGASPIDAAREEPDMPRPTRRKSSREGHGTSTAISRDFPSDANDADQSAAGETTEDAEDGSTGRDDSDTKPVATERTRAPAAPAQKPDVGDEEDDTEGEEMDPEVKRRMEIRERMAKMSGGMGMAGMFGPPGGMPSAAASKKKKSSGEHQRAVEEETSQVERAPPVPIMPISRKVPSFGSPTVEKEADSMKPREEEVESEDEEPAPKLVERGHQLPPVPQERPVPQVPQPKSATERGAPPPPPTQSRPLPLPPTLPSRTADSESEDDEIPVQTNRKSRQLDEASPTGAPPVPSSGAPGIPSRPLPPPAPKTDRRDISSPTEAASPVESNKRSSFIPPIPGAAPAPPSHSQSRPPPPPPPGPPSAPSRKSTDQTVASPKQLDESEREYEGDYDTDIAPGATHKEALKSHMREPSLDESTTADDNPVRSPMISPPIVPRAVPPPLPNQATRPGRQSMDTPRAPPPPPPTRDISAIGDEDYDPYRYSGSKSTAAAVPPLSTGRTGEQDSDHDLYDASPQENRSAVGALPTSPQPPPPPVRQSLDAPRQSTSSRRSTDQPRLSSDHHGVMATDVDLSPSTLWYTQDQQPTLLPPQLQPRAADLLVEVDSSTTTQRGGKSTISKDIYIVFPDYSQTVISARFDPANPGATAALSQRHEPPPSPLQKNALEEASSAYGARLAEVAASRVNHSAVGDGSPLALVRDLITAISSAKGAAPTAAPLPPIGRSSGAAFGIPVYMNLANASISQADEIRGGDIVVFRKARFQGHRGPVHKAYSTEVGGSSSAGSRAKGEHVGVVMDWDGTKRKIRCWEQGRDFAGEEGEANASASKKDKVKLESYKLGDLKSGEVKVWRVVGKSWVNWA